jgi:acetyltransferase-like isoleucine patch superfamily enzyme
VTSPAAWIKQIIHEQLLRKRFPRSVFHSGATVDKGSLLGEHSVLFQNAALLNSSLGAYSYVQSNSVICNAEIGRFCSIAGNVAIGLGAHPTHMVSTSPVFYDNSQPLPKFLTKKCVFTETLPRTFIGADVWIGQGVMIKAGITIGVGAVIGAGSIVTKDIAPYVIAAGNPCREIRQRFPDITIQQLIQSRWWELDTATLEKLAPDFVDVEKFLAALKQI